MTIHKIIRLNLFLIIALGIYGLVIEEPYWRDVGHSPYFYDYLFWFGLFLNGPSGFAADYLSWLLHVHVDWRFLAQYGFWCLLLWLQWRAYHAAAVWRLGNSQRAMILYFVSLLTAHYDCSGLRRLRSVDIWAAADGYLF